LTGLKRGETVYNSKKTVNSARKIAKTKRLCYDKNSSLEAAEVKNI